MDSLEKNKQYKEEKKKELSDSKLKVKIEKGKVLNREKSEKLVKARRSRIASSQKSSNLTKKVSKGILIPKKKKKTKTRGQLVKELDQIFSRYIRMRDADKKGICTCVTCGDKKPRKEMQACHFISRSVYRYRRSEMNVRAGCYKCNVLLKGNYIPYTLFMIKKYGEDKIREMQENRELIKVTTPEIVYGIQMYSLKVEGLMNAKSL